VYGYEQDVRYKQNLLVIIEDGVNIGFINELLRSLRKLVVVKLSANMRYIK
jgi:hypothetical protein